MGLDIHSIHRLDLGTPEKNPLTPPQNVFPQGFPRMILFQKHFDPLSHNYFSGSATCQASTPSVLHPPLPLQLNVSNMF